MNECLDFMFHDAETGETFFVEVRNNFCYEECLAEAKKIAKENFEAPCLVDIFSQEEADFLGYDTY